MTSQQRGAIPKVMLRTPEEAWGRLAEAAELNFKSFLRQLGIPKFAFAIVMEGGMLVALENPEWALAFLRLLHSNESVDGPEALEQWRADTREWIAATNIETHEEVRR